MIIRLIKNNLMSIALMMFLTLHISANATLVSGFVKNNGQVVNQNGIVQSDVLYCYSQGNFKLMLKKHGFSYEYIGFDGKDYANKYDVFNTIMQPVYNRTDVGFTNSNSNILVVESNKINYVANYIVQKNSLKCSVFKEITYQNIYNGIDLLFKINANNNLEYEFIVHPNANPSQIQLSYNTDQKTKLTDMGELLIENKYGFIKEHKPITFLSVSKEIVKSEFQFKNNILSFNIGKYNANEEITIDPLVTWGNYLGGIGVDVNTSVCKKNDILYVTGYTSSSNNIASTGSYQGVYGGGLDAFIAKFDTSGTLLWATYYGGIENNAGLKCSVDNSNNVYVCGYSENSAVIATSGNGLQSNYGGGLTDGFVSKFSSTGSLVWGSFYGGTQDDVANSLFVEPISQNIVVVGKTKSSDLPMFASLGYITSQSTFGGIEDGFILKLLPTAQPLYSTFYGGAAIDVLMDVKIFNSETMIVGYTSSSNNVISSFPTSYLADAMQQGEEGLIVKFNNAGNRLWGTYFGGNSNDRLLALDYSNATCNQIAAVGYSYSDSISSPIKDTLRKKINNGGKDAILTCYSDSGKACNFRFYGGALDDEATDVDLSNIYQYVTISGNTNSTSQISYNITTGGINLQGPTDGFISNFYPSLDIRTGEYWGGEGTDYLYDLAGLNSYYLVGATNSGSNIAVNANYQSSLAGGTSDGILTKLYVLPLVPTTISSPCCSGFGGGNCAPPPTVSVCANVNPPPISLIIPIYDDENQADYTITLPDGSVIFASAGVVVYVSAGGVVTTNNQYGVVSMFACSIPDLYTFPIPTVNIVASDYNLCVGECSTLTVTYFGGTPSYTNGIWNTGSVSNTLIVCPFGNAPCVPYSYFYSITDYNNCKVTETVSINVLNPIPTQTLYPVCNYSLGLNISPSCYNSAANYTWSPFNSNNVIGQNSGQGDNIDNTLVLIDPTIGGSISYSVVGNYLGCTSSPNINTITIQLNPIPQITSAIPQSSICSGSIFSYTPTSNVLGTTYNIFGSSIFGNPNGYLSFSNLSYINNILNTGYNNGIVSYNLYPSYNGCNGSVQTVTVLVYANPYLSISSNTACYGQSQTLNASGNIIGGMPTYSVQWATPTYTVNGLGPVNQSLSVTTTYSVIITDANNCKTINFYTLYIDTIITQPSFSIDTTVCKGLPIVFNIASNSNYAWTPNTYISNTTLSSTTVTPLSSVNYTIQGIGNYGCKSSTTINIHTKVDAPLESNFTIEVDSCFASASFKALNASTNYYWSFGDNLFLENEINPTHFYESSQTYTVQLVQTQSSICSNYPVLIDTAIKLIVIPHSPYQINQIPNVFTPNKDGVNDIFKIGSDYCKEIELIIYNRWGQVVNKTHDNYWNGKMQNIGANADDGTYFYLINYNNKNAPKKSASGFLTLFR